MAPPPPDPAPQPTPPRLHPVVTALCAIVTAAAGLFTIYLSFGGPTRLALLDQPLQSALRYHDRELEMAAVDTGPGTRWLERLVTSAAPDVRAQAARAYRELLAAADAGDLAASPEERLRLQARLALVHGEAGERDALAEAVRGLEPAGPAGARLAAALRLAYSLPGDAGEPDVLDEAVAALVDPAHPGATWATDVLAARVSAREGATARAAEAEARLLARGEAARRRALALALVSLALVAGGLALGAWLRLRREPLPRLADGVSPAPWTPGRGFAVTVRSATFGLLLLVAYQFAVGEAFLPVGTLIGSLPMLYYLRRVLLPPHRLGVWTAFGLELDSRTRDLLLAAAVLVGLELAIASAAGLIGGALGAGRWYEGVQEEALVGTDARAMAFFVEAVLWAPLLEELACRGLIYTTLRTVMGPWPAALASAALFTLPHAYSAPAALSLFGAAVVSALVYERTRSLWPSIIGHAVNNALAVAGTLLVYR